jgi:hypothetical protein
MGDIPDNFTVGLRGFCITQRGRVQCRYALDAPALNLTEGILASELYPDVWGLLYLDFLLSLSTLFLSGVLFPVIGIGFCVHAATIMVISLPIFPAAGIVMIFAWVERQLVSYGCSVISGGAQGFTWASLGCSVGAVLAAVGVVFGKSEREGEGKR